MVLRVQDSSQTYVRKMRSGEKRPEKEALRSVSLSDAINLPGEAVARNLQPTLRAGQRSGAVHQRPLCRVFLQEEHRVGTGRAVSVLRQSSTLRCQELEQFACARCRGGTPKEGCSDNERDPEHEGVREEPLEMDASAGLSSQVAQARPSDGATPGRCKQACRTSTVR